MKSPTLQALGWILLTACTPLYTQSQTKPVKKDAVSSISGKVTINGKGARGIVVGLRPADAYSQGTVINKGTTDQEGNYRITNVVPGTYEVTPTALAFVVSGESRDKRLIIAAGETVEDIDFTLSRGGVITGKVTDSDGRPLIEERITLLPVGEPDDWRIARMFSQLNNMTDDRGVYRIFGIPQGKYRVSVGQSEDGFVYPGPRRSPYKQTFHPAGTDVSKAAVIEVAEGSEATNIDITVATTLPTFTATGRIVDGETGQPLPNVNYAIRMLQQGSMTSAEFISDGRGEFKLANLRPGKYSVVIPPQANGDKRAEPVQFEVIDQDVSGLLVKALPGTTVSGVIVLEGAKDSSVFSRLRLAQMHAYVAPPGPGDLDWGQGLNIAPDGSFRLGGLPSGLLHFALNHLSTGESSGFGFTILRVERDGIAQPLGVEIREGEQVTGVRVVVGYGTGTIRGQVKVEGGELPTSARFGVWLSRPGDDRNDQRFQWPPSSIDSRGRFIIEGLPAGTYEVHAAVHIPNRNGPPLRQKQQVNVSDGVVTEVTITLELNPNPSPTRP